MTFFYFFLSTNLNLGEQLRLFGREGDKKANERVKKIIAATKRQANRAN